MRFFGLACAVALVAAACGGSTADNGGDAGDNSDATPAEASTDDAAAPDAPATYPAAHTAMPQVDYNGGRLLLNPKIVTVTFASDDATMVSRVQQFDDIITTTPWWTAVSSEYCIQPGNAPCIGQGSAGGHVVINDVPDATYTDSASGPSSLKDFIKAHVLGGGDAGAAPDFPPADSNTLYVIYFPKGVSISLDGDMSCGDYLAYHDTIVLPDPNNVDIGVAYAAIPRCGTKESTTTDSASHEIIEAATDPEVGINAVAYYMLNQLWASPTSGGEVGDLCVGKTTTESSFVVQRIWSNKSAAAGNDPCVPIPSTEIYFNSAPRQQKIVLTKVGSTATVDIDAYSDAPYPPWTISATDDAAFQGTAMLSFSLDKTMVQNGDHAVLTVTAVAPITSAGDVLYVSSKDTTGNRHNWPVQVSNK